MPKLAALLRGINVGGRGLIAMSALRQMCEELGFADVTTVLQSGNVVLRSARLVGAALERRLETETAGRLGVPVDYLVRSAAEWVRVIERNPFPDAARNDPSHLLVMFLKSPALGKALADLRAALAGPEQIAGDGRQLYLVYPDGIARSKLTGALIERKLATRGTARNWNTILKIQGLLR